MSQTPILHADLDAFYASVEQRDDPSLAGIPVIVGSGIVLACSYEAKDSGVKTAMNIRQAVRLCPAAKVVPPRMEAYSETSRHVYEVFAGTAPVVEGLSIDEAFLDVGGQEHISGNPVETAHQLRRQVREEVGLTISVGVARTKFLAKVASARAKPDGLLVVEPEHEDEFLHPLPIEALWGVGRVTSRKLRDTGIETVGEITDADPERLARLIGRSAAARLIELANNRDPRPVKPRARRKSIGAQSAFPNGSKSDAEVDALLASLVDRSARRLRKAERRCQSISVGLRFADMTRAARSHTFPAPVDGTGEILACARQLLASLRTQASKRGLTLIGVSLESLDDNRTAQMALPVNGEKAPEALDRALDDLHERFGSGAVVRASLVDREGPQPGPTLPD